MIIKDKFVLALYREPGINKFISLIVSVGLFLTGIMLLRAIFGF